MAVPQIIIDRAGLRLPTYDELHLYFRGVYQDVYGTDIVITPDSQDGQLLAIMSLAVHDAYSAAAAVYNSFSPSTAQGVGLARVVKINGITKHVATYSTADLRIVGQPGTIIRGGIVSDVQEQRWLLPDIVTIPENGEPTALTVYLDRTVQVNGVTKAIFPQAVVNLVREVTLHVNG